MFSNLYEKIVNGEEKISLVGLGYVGMPIAVAFSKKVKSEKVDKYMSEIKKVREELPVLKNKRKDLYEVIEK